MTDKEWKELCKWVKILEKTAFVRVYEDHISVEGLEFTKCGDIECNYGEYCLVENQRLKNELDKQIKVNRKLVRAVKSALNFLACPDVIDEDTCNEQLAFDELRDVLKEVGEEE